MTTDAAMSRRPGGRPAAGTDPGKRQQILEAAGRLFAAVGFDAASMSDIASEANVSKPTLYVYFTSKEQLFSAICAERRNRNVAELIAILVPGAPVEETLTSFGIAALKRLLEPFVIAAHRTVIGVAERMPEIGREFFEAGPKRLAGALAAYLDGHVAAGRLRTDDTYLAAVQYLELIQATIYRPRLYGATDAKLSDRDVERIVKSAVRLIIAGYGVSRRR